MKSHFLRFCSFLILSLGVLSLAAQDSIRLGGVVYEKTSNEPLPGVALFLKNTAIGTLTNKDGLYQLPCKTGDSVVVSYVGYKKIEWKADAPQKDFYLEEDLDARPSGVMTYIYGHNFSVFPSISFRNSDVGMGVSYTHSLYSYLGLNATYVNSDLSDNGLFFTELQALVPVIPFRIPTSDLNLIPSFGGGYYWNMSDKLKMKKGGMVMSTDLMFYKKNFFKGNRSFGIALSGGYNWFVSDHDADYFYIGIRLFPFTKVKKY